VALWSKLASFCGWDMLTNHSTRMHHVPHTGDLPNTVLSPKLFLLSDKLLILIPIGFRYSQLPTLVSNSCPLTTT
jgi:hypothetical protein